MEGVKDIVRREMESLKTAIQKRMEESHFNASGRTSASLHVEVDGDTATLLGSKALLVAERGRKPGAVPHNFFAIIRQWVLDKGISYADYQPKGVTATLSPEQKLNSLSGAIAYTIMKEGTLLHRKGMTRDIYGEALEKALNNISEGVAGVLSLEIETINQNYSKDEDNND